MTNIDVLDKGYVRLVDHMGDDLSAVNAARVSYDKESDVLSSRDEKLLTFLLREGHTCYDEKTEVFTDRGWMPWREVCDETYLAAVREDGSFSYEKPVRLVAEHYIGEMAHLDHRDASMMVTPNHRLFVSKRGHQGFGDYQTVMAKDLGTTGEYRLLSSATLTETFVVRDNASREKYPPTTIGGGSYHEGWLLGFFLGDGHRASVNRVTFNLRKESKISALRAALDEVDPDNYTVSDNGVIRWENSDPMFEGEAKTKRIPAECFDLSLEYRRGIFAGLLESDGSAKRSAWSFGSSSEGLVDDFQRLGTTIGEYVKLNKEQNGLSKAMVLSRSTTPRFHASEIEWVLYDGLVYCAEVSTGLLLVRRNNTVHVSGNSPFRHAAVCYEVYAPLFVARQWWKYAVASTHIDDQNGWNESSRRYITEEPVFHIPGVGEWRMKPENSKQGSGDFFGQGMGAYFSKRLGEVIDISLREYESALQMGVAPEQARLFLAAYGMYVRWRWTTSVQGLLHFLSQRLNHDAQKEIQQYAQAVHDLTQPLFPVTFQAFLGSGNDA